MVDVLGMCFLRIPFEGIYMHDIYYVYRYALEGKRITYRRGLRSCLSLRGGKFEGLEREISNEYGSHALFMFCSYEPKLRIFLLEMAR